MMELVFYPTQIKVDATNSFYAHDPYIEQFWLKILGPTATLLVNHLVLKSMTSNKAYKPNLNDLSMVLGTGSRSGVGCPASKQLKRLVSHQMIFQIQDNEYLVPKCVGVLSSHMLSKLDSTTQNQHETWMARLNISPLSTQRKRMRTLLSLLDHMGATKAEIETAIASCGLHPSIIGESLQFVSLKSGAA